MKKALWCLGLLCAVWSTGAAQTPPLPPCLERPTVLQRPTVDYNRWCLEEALPLAGDELMALTKLAFAPDGRLFAARPRTGEVLLVGQTPQDPFPYQPRVIASGLTYPNGLAYHDGALYIAGGKHVHRLADDGTLTTLADDLPSGAGWWTSGLAVGPDGRLYIGIGAPCDNCEPDNPERGAIISLAQDGGDRQLVARGLRHPSDLVFKDQQLWAVDSPRGGFASVPRTSTGPQAGMDELNLIEAGAHYGWPYCVGRLNIPDLPSETFDCERATPPRAAFRTYSAPNGLALYDHDAFPGLSGALLVTLGGNSDNQTRITGYAVVAVHLDDVGYAIAIEALIPFNRRDGNYSLYPYDPRSGFRDIDNLWANSFQGLGLYPHHPQDIAVSPQGWIFISVGGGQLLVLRPN